MIAQNLQKLIGEAMKARDGVRLSTLRMLSSALNYEKIEKQHELTDEEELAVIRKQAKQRRDSIEAYKKAGAKELAEKEGAELRVLQEFLPPEMEDSDLIKFIDEAIAATKASSPSEIGKVIGVVKSKAPNVEGGRIASLVKDRLK